MKVCLSLVLIAACILRASANATNNEPELADWYEVDLDLPPMERWVKVMKSFDPKFLEETIKSIFSYALPGELFPYVADIFTGMIERVPEPYKGEIIGMSVASGIPVGELVMANVIYDVSAFGHNKTNKACTSIIAVDSVGNLIHGRNLDYAAPDDLRKITIQVDFLRHGQVAYTTTTYAGFVGAITGYVPNLFTISGDERDKGSLLDNLKALAKGDEFAFFLEREVLDKATSYNDAMQMIMKMPTIAPVYLILGGVRPNEGAVITKTAGGVANVTHLGNNSVTPDWYIVETNYDLWDKPPASDDRRDAAIKAMNEVGQANITADTLVQVLSTPPVFNYHTSYTAVMQARKRFYFTWIRYDAPKQPAN